MAYETGTASTIVDILDAIRTFAVSLGWTQNAWTDDTHDGYAGKWLSVSTPGGSYFNLHSVDEGIARWAIVGGRQNPSIAVLGATGYSGALAWDAQPGTHSQYALVNDLATPITAYHLFGSATYLHAVIQINATAYAHIVLGEVDKHATFTGGSYVGATYAEVDGLDYDEDYTSIHNPFDSHTSGAIIYRSHVHVDIDGLTDNWFDFPTAHSIVRENTIAPTHYYYRSISSVDHSTVFLPIHLWVPRPASHWSIIGTVPDMRFINMQYLTDGEILTLGSDQWQVFPCVASTDVGLPPNSGDYAFAYKKVI